MRALIEALEPYRMEPVPDIRIKLVPPPARESLGEGRGERRDPF